MHKIVYLLAQINIDPQVPMNEPTQDSIRGLLQLMFGAFAAIAVLIITIASILFALSRGDPQKAARARNTIIYTGVGLAVALAGQAIVTFVIGNA